MTAVNQLTLLEQRRVLRQKLLTQRQLIATQLDSTAEIDTYPRSMTMRFLTGKSAFGTQLLKSGVTLLGVSAVKSLAAPLIMSMFARRTQR